MSTTRLLVLGAVRIFQPINNAGGTKLDYYLRSAVRYSFEAAHGDTQDDSVAIRLRNDAPASGLPEYVVIRPDLPGK